jgi:two-component system nitrate/nitrite sensor histidine kinase NarX
MWAPLAVKGRIMGGIGIGHAASNYFTTYHASLVTTIANQAAVSMVNADLYERAQTLSVMQERQRLGQALHDVVNQSLFSANLIADILPRLWEKDPEEARNSLENLRRLTKSAMAEMRRMMTELRPSALSEVNISDLLNLLGDAFTGRTNVPVEIHVGEEFSLPLEVKVVFFRFCQEALNNIAKHARPSKVEILLLCHEGWVDLSVQDDGKGFDTQHLPAGHYGLSIMRERADMIGAILSVESEPGKGTKVELSWTENMERETV